MGSVIALSVSAFCGAVLFLMAVALVLAFPRVSAVRLWAVSWTLAALGCFLVFLSPLVETYFLASLELAVRTTLVLGSQLTLALGFLSWFQVSPAQGKGVLVRTILWGGSFLALVPVALGLTETSLVAWALVALWSFVPVVVAVTVVALLGLPRAKGPTRTQSLSLLQALAFGAVPFTLTWVVLPSFPSAGWDLGLPPFLLLGAALTFRSLVHFDTRFHHHHASPFFLQKTQDTVLFLAADGRIQDINPAVRTLLDTDEASLVGRTLSALGADDEAKRLLVPLEALTFTDWEGDLSLGNRTGDPVPVHLVFRRVHNPAREAIGAVLLLYDERRPSTEDHSSRIDPVTHLNNRRWTLELLEAEFQRVKRYGGPLTALWITATQPGQTDEVVMRLGAVLRGALRKTDFCGRLGSGEFLVVLPGTPPDKALVVANRLDRMFALALDGEAYDPGLRMGLAGLDEDLGSTDDFLARVRASLLPAVSPG